MNKKLVTMVLALFVLLAGKVNAATLTQYVGDIYISQIVNEGQQVKMRFVNQSGYTFKKWIVESGNISIDTTSQSITFTMPSTNVVLRGDYVEASGVETPDDAMKEATITARIYEPEGTLKSTKTLVNTYSEYQSTITVNANGLLHKSHASEETIYTYASGTPSSVTIAGTNYDVGETYTLPITDSTIDIVVNSNKKILASTVKVGDYITYVPSSTSYTVASTVSGYSSNQKYNPSNTRSWRVFSNDGTNVEIISTDSLGAIYLRGSAGYINAVQTLNDISAAYINPTYATSGRSLGYSEKGLTSAQIANYKVINTSIYPLEYGISSVFPYNDNQHISDASVLTKYGLSGNKQTWIAARFAGTDTSYAQTFFGVQELFGNRISSFNVFSNNSSSEYSNYSWGVRPIITLKSDLIITGSGTSDEPYIINTANSSQYTVTYSANGGYGDMLPQSIAKGSSITLNAYAYAHHSKIFAGWSTSATATTPNYTNGRTITPTSDITLYAIWKTSDIYDCFCGSCNNKVAEEYSYCTTCKNAGCSDMDYGRCPECQKAVCVVGELTYCASCGYICSACCNCGSTTYKCACEECGSFVSTMGEYCSSCSGGVCEYCSGTQEYYCIVCRDDGAIDICPNSVCVSCHQPEGKCDQNCEWYQQKMQ